MFTTSKIFKVKSCNDFAVTITTDEEQYIVRAGIGNGFYTRHLSEALKKYSELIEFWVDQESVCPR